MDVAPEPPEYPGGLAQVEGFPISWPSPTVAPESNPRAMPVGEDEPASWLNFGMEPPQGGVGTPGAKDQGEGGNMYLESPELLSLMLKELARGLERDRKALQEEGFRGGSSGSAPVPAEEAEEMQATGKPEISNDCTEEYTAHKEKYRPGTAMENLNVLSPDLTEEQQAIFQTAFTADANYLENHEKMNQSFWQSLVKCLATTDPPILSTEEKNNLLNSCNVLPGGCAACLKAIEEKGVRAMAVLYLLLKTINPSGYRQLPSSEEKDEKFKPLKILERKLMLSQGEKKAENSSCESMDEHTQDSDEEDLGRQKTEGQLLGGIPAEVVPYRDSEITRREDSTTDAYENKNAHLHQWTVRWMGIRKDDEFFHFVILCFAIGALLICYYYYKDWTISLGIGLITFASLETTGIYFGLVYRIRSVLDSFVPLIGKFRPTGNSDLLTDCMHIP
ncbi:transmembrane protein 40 [Chlamydotis macqueenii]